VDRVAIHESGLQAKPASENDSYRAHTHSIVTVIKPCLLIEEAAVE